RELRHGGVEIASKTRSGKNTVKAGDGVGRSEKKRAHNLQSFRKTPKDVENFRGFIFRQLHELIVGFQRFQRLEEHGLTSTAGAVDDPGYVTTILGAHWDHEAIVTQRDVILACAGVARAQNLLQCFLDRLARLRNAGTNPA